MRALSLFYRNFFQQNSFNMLLQKSVCMRTCVCVYRVCMYVCRVPCACVRMCAVCVLARAIHTGTMMDPYDVARLFLSTNERKGEKDREEKRVGIS